MLLLVGLGNPGPKHAGNRHNIGFMALDTIVARYEFSSWRSRFSGMGAEGNIGGVRVLALKPMTYMNLSGRSVVEAVRFFKMDPETVTVIHDEIDLPPGKIRIKIGGGHGGHNGIRDIIAHIGADFRRVRVGIGHPGDKTKVHGYVLKDIAKEERSVAEKTIDALCDAAPLLAAGDDGRAMNKISLALQPPSVNRKKPGRPAANQEPKQEPKQENGDPKGGL